MSDDKKSFWQVFKWAISSILLSVGTVIIGFFLGFIRRGKLSDNGDGINDAREQLENISRDSERLTETNRTTEEILRKVRERKKQSCD